MSENQFVYILTNAHRTVFYTGSTSNLAMRLDQHMRGESAFTAKYNCMRLVWFEEFAGYDEAYAFEHKLKRWKREWKVSLIEKANPEWLDLDPPS